MAVVRVAPSLLQHLLGGLLDLLADVRLVDEALKAIGDRRLEPRLEQRHHLVAPVAGPGHRSASKGAEALDHRPGPECPRGERVGGQLLLAGNLLRHPQEHPAVPEKRQLQDRALT